MFTVRTKLVSRIPEAEKNLWRQVDEIVGEGAQDAADICFRLTPRSDNNEPGHVHTQDTIHVQRVAAGRYELRAGGAIVFIELGSSTTVARAPMRTAINMTYPAMIRKLQGMKLL